jgi:antitoxin (DNA-binding transcriptional repressor) of toxin-antitoxin stability system
VSVTVGVREFRENLRAYLERVRAGEEVVVTERGTPIARITKPIPSYVGIGEGPGDLSIRAEEYLRELIDAD